MRKLILPKQGASGQWPPRTATTTASGDGSTGPTLVVRRLNTPSKFEEVFQIPQIIPGFIRNGFVLLAGLTESLSLLSPLKNPEAWHALHNPSVAGLLHSNVDQQFHYSLDDFGRVHQDPHHSIEFVVKREKSYLTIVEGSDSICAYPLLPEHVRSYLAGSIGVLRQIRSYLDCLIPQTEHPTHLTLRVFDYHSSDLLADLRPPTAREDAMRPHVDGSLFTLIIANSDGLLSLLFQGAWRVAMHQERRPFALLIPGVAALHDFGISPTPHMVQTGGARRVSVTAFLTPKLGSSLSIAEQQRKKWRLSPSFF